MLLTQESPRHHLKLLWWLRSIAIAGQSATVAFCTLALGLPLPLAPLFCIIALLLFINILTLLRLKLAAPVTQAEFFAQMLIDMLGLAGLLYFTGGASNPFTSLFILQVVIAAIALPGVYCWLVAAAAIALYTALMLFKIDLPMLSHQHGGDFFSLHVQGMWVNFLLLALLLAWFVTRIAETLRRQDRLFAEAEQLATLGTFATQAAHDLGTPLATMAILAGEYRSRATTDAEISAAGTLLKEIARCKQGISRIAASAGVMRAESGVPVALDAYITLMAERFREARPEAQFELEMQGSLPPPVISAGVGFEQALANLLANAADASARVGLSARWTPWSLTLSITDEGAGLPEAIRRTLGEPGVTTKPEGLGMGLYLAKTVILRLQGTLTALRHTPRGTILTITLPLARMLS